MKKLILIAALASALFADVCYDNLSGAAAYTRKLAYDVKVDDFYLANHDHSMFKLYIRDAIINCPKENTKQIEEMREKISNAFFARFGDRVQR